MWKNQRAKIVNCLKHELERIWPMASLVLAAFIQMAPLCNMEIALAPCSSSLLSKVPAGWWFWGVATVLGLTGVAVARGALVCMAFDQRVKTGSNDNDSYLQCLAL